MKLKPQDTGNWSFPQDHRSSQYVDINIRLSFPNMLSYVWILWTGDCV